MHFLQTFASAAAIASVANAHMVMKTPKPYGFAHGSLNNSPLSADGSDYPCKVSPETGKLQGQPSEYKAGDKVTLSFTGSAVHGGGSCQVSLTTDEQPTKQTKFKTILSIEGGCPAKANGNMGGNDDTKFGFQIPKGIPDGRYTLAWTWFNKIGNREMYMNCAPIKVTGSEAKGKKLEDLGLPDMFVANIGDIGGQKCTTKESVSVKFPNPGQNILYNDDKKTIGEPTGGCKPGDKPKDDPSTKMSYMKVLGGGGGGAGGAGGGAPPQQRSHLEENGSPCQDEGSLVGAGATRHPRQFRPADHAKPLRRGPHHV